MNYIVEFIGGPRDGETRVLPSLAPVRIIRVLRTNFSFDEPDPSTLPMPESEILNYEVILDPVTITPTRTAEGHYRFGYRP